MTPATPGSTTAPRGGRAGGLRLLRRGAVLVALVAVLALVFGVRTFRVQGSSMAPALKDGEVVLATPTGGPLGWFPGPEVGDVVVVDAQAAWSTDIARDVVIKRLVAGPGDRIRCCERGRLVRNGRVVTQAWGSSPSGTQAGADLEFDAELGTGQWWVMGDLWADSNDSRTHLASPGGGAVRGEEIMAHVRWQL